LLLSRCVSRGHSSAKKERDTNIRYYEQLIPLTVSLFADSELIERHRMWMQEQNTGPQRIYERVTAYIEAEQRLGRIVGSLEAFSVASLCLVRVFSTLSCATSRVQSHCH
jgi:hypothetical protein